MRQKRLGCDKISFLIMKSKFVFAISISTFFTNAPSGVSKPYITINLLLWETLILKTMVSKARINFIPDWYSNFVRIVRLLDKLPALLAFFYIFGTQLR